MQTKEQNIWLTPSEVLKKRTIICKICLKPRQNEGIYDLIYDSRCVCNKCLNRLKPHFYKFKIDDVSVCAIYRYDDDIKSFIYQLKGCYDVELAPIFLFRFIDEIKLAYRNYIILPAPSYYKKEEEREFNHLEEIFKCLDLKICKYFVKIADIKQSDQSFEERKNIKNYIRLNKSKELYNKKILLVDDVYTSGSTIKAMIDLVKKSHPKDIKVLLLSLNTKDEK